MDLPAFKREIAANEAHTLAACVARLRAAGMSEPGLRYVASIQGYAKAPYYTTVWMQDEACRHRVGLAVCTHAIGVKLLDDLIDRDSPLESRDLVLGVTLLQHADSRLAAFAGAAGALAALDRDFTRIWSQVVRDTREPAATLERWLLDARVKSGTMLSSYAEVCCRTVGAIGAVARARRFAEALGTLYMLGDDWMDFTEQRQASANLAHLIATGQVPLTSVESAIDELKAEGAAALSGAAIVCDLQPFLNHFARKLKRLYGELAPAPGALAYTSPSPARPTVGRSRSRARPTR